MVSRVLVVVRVVLVFLILVSLMILVSGWVVTLVMDGLFLSMVRDLVTSLVRLCALPVFCVFLTLVAQLGLMVIMVNVNMSFVMLINSVMGWHRMVKRLLMV